MSVSERQERRIIIWLIFLIIILVALLVITLHTKGFITILERPSPSSSPATTTPQTPEFLHEEEGVPVESSTSSSALLPLDRVLFEYVEVMDGCGPHFEGTCLNVRTGPGTDYPSTAKLRNGMVLKVGGKVDRTYEIATTTFSTISSTTITSTTTVTETWYKIVFDEWLRYPERVKSDWYVRSDFVQILYDEGDKTSWDDGNASTTKRIVVERSKQKLTAYEGDVLFKEFSISTGLALTPTPRGVFTVFKKTPSRYMQGPLPNLADRQVYDLPGVPWNLYFTHGGAVIHGAYWHNSFGSRYSHGCVNLPPSDAYALYNWAPLGTTVIVKD